MTSDLVYEVLGLDYLRLNFSAPRVCRTRISASADFRSAVLREDDIAENTGCGARLPGFGIKLYYVQAV